MLRVYPEPGDVDVAELIAGLNLGARAPADRPYVVVNFISSVDGRASFDGGSTGLAVDGDKDIFRALRGVADAVLAGTGTLHAERYGLLATDPATVGLRARLGKPAQPLAVTVTRSGRVDPDLPLLAEPAAHMTIYTGAPLSLGRPRADVEIIRADDPPTFTGALHDLRTRKDIRLLLCEGGPSVFGDLVAAGLADELFLTLAAKLAGGEPAPITAHLDLDSPADLELRWALQRGGSLFLRYGLSAP